MENRVAAKIVVVGPVMHVFWVFARNVSLRVTRRDIEWCLNDIDLGPKTKINVVYRLKAGRFERVKKQT